jgi:hypothetical protein
MGDEETFQFTCRCNIRPFEISEDAPSRSFNLFLGVITLGVWLAVYALYRLGHVYWISRCPLCGKRSRSLFWILLILLFFTMELGRTLHYFLISAPQKIVTDASFATLPKDFDMNAPLKISDYKTAVGFVWLVAALPSAGMFISTYWPYMILAWGSVLTLAGLIVPSWYLQRRNL